MSKYISKKILLMLLFFAIVPLCNAKNGQMKLLAVSEIEDKESGSSADLFLEIKPGNGRIFIDSFPLTKLDTVMSTRFANEIACDYSDTDCEKYDFFYTIRANAAIVGGPSAGAAIALLTISVLEEWTIDETISITGTINSGGLVGPVSGISEKITYADKMGLKKIMIPKWSSINESTIAELQENTEIEIVKVGNLREAIYEFNGRTYDKNYSIIIDTDYIERMKNISEGICQRSADISVSSKENISILNDANELLAFGLGAIEKENYYSAASYCFGANVKFKYFRYLDSDLDEQEINEEIIHYENKTKEYKEIISKKTIETITDLQTYMVVNERLMNSQEYFSAAKENLIGNDTDVNSSLYNLAFGIERFNSAVFWSTFFGKPGQKFIIDEKSVAESCLKKISEVEERIEYLKLYIPLAFEQTKKELSYAYDDYNSKEYSLCLFKASNAKAEIDIVLNSMGLDDEKTMLLIEDRILEAEQIIGKQIEKNVFPIIGYSYYEYAKSLKDNDKFSALLYLEYAIELSKLDIYFREKRIYLPRIDPLYVYLISVGFVLGFFACFTWMRKEYGVRHKKKRQR
ncbi:MAG: hypothetical protein KKF44_05935 [Nanoarchaeota archaeon]|nr:hypothetical protein [Nanoarchaeota archaeon]